MQRGTHLRHEDKSLSVWEHGKGGCQKKLSFMEGLISQKGYNQPGRYHIPKRAWSLVMNKHNQYGVYFESQRPMLKQPVTQS